VWIEIRINTFYPKHEPKHFFKASLAYGIYDNEYHVIAIYCSKTNNKHNPPFFHKKAAKSVKTIIIKTIIVAIKRVGANIFFICLNGPIKKHVLNNEQMLPSENNKPNMTKLRKNTATDPKIDKTKPRTKHPINPLIRVSQLNELASRTSLIIPPASSSWSFPDNTRLNLSIFFWSIWKNNIYRDKSIIDPVFFG